MKTYIFIYILIIGVVSCVYGQSRIGIVVDSLDVAISQVSITDVSTRTMIVSDQSGFFTIPEGKLRLEFRHQSYISLLQDIPAGTDTVKVTMWSISREIDVVDVFSTGYSSIPKERATGSFSVLDGQILEKRVTSSVLESIEGLAPGLQFDRRRGGADINIRGINTLSLGMMGPLIIVDNFPYQGDINDINPNDVHSVTLLKDAAATSIWGARAGNGVIVIQTKKANKKNLQVEVNKNLKLVSKSDPYYYPTISSSDFIEVERMLFENGLYTALLTSNTNKQYVFSPVVELLDRHQKGEVSLEEVEQQIARFKTLDYRDDIEKYFYRNPLLQQYQVAISGGNEWITQRTSLGYEKQSADQVGSHQNRISLNWNNQIKPAKNLQITTALLYSYRNNNNEGGIDYPIAVGGGKIRLYPYAQLMGSEGEVLSIPFGYNYNYVDTISIDGMRDWKYRPLEEIGRSERKTVSQSLNANISVKYNLVDILSIEGLYNVELNDTRSRYVQSEDAFYVRNLFNRFGYLSGEKFLSRIPDGGILDASTSNALGQRARLQLSFAERLRHSHISLFAGTEISDRTTNSLSSRYYGYTDMMTSQAVNTVDTYPVFDGLGSSGTIPIPSGLSQTRNRFVSFYVNGAYDFLGRYVLSASARKDASNLFGVKTNERWNPLWSLGGLWNVHREPFMESVDWLDVLKLKATLGHSGNAGGVASTLPVIQYLTPSTSSLYKIKRAMINTLPNESLKWEDVQMVNLGTEISLLDGRINASFDYFFKHSTDLISNDPIDPTSGFGNIDRNVAEIRGRGFDFEFRTKNVNGDFQWETSFIWSKATNKVTKFYGSLANSLRYVSYAGASLTPLEDRMLYPVFSYRFTGLDAQSGDPQGLLDGEISKDYAALLRDSLDALVYHGTGLPVFHGSFQNTFRYGNIELWCNLGFKYGHYFQRETIRYNDLYNSWIGHADYAKRWQRSGDELNTSVPSATYPANSNRDDFYSYSEANIDRGSLIRLQDVRLAYNYTPASVTRIRRISLFLAASNLGTLWKATKSSIDPDYMSNPRPSTYALGFKLLL